MKDYFSLHRILLLFRADWIEYRKYIGYALAAFVAYMGVFLWLSLNADAQNYIRKEFVLYWCGTIASMLFFCWYAGKKTHRSKGLTLTLPASTEEKYVALLTEGLLILVAFNLLFWGATGCWSMLFPYFPVISPEEICRKTNMSGPIITFILSLLFLSYVTFRKHALAIVLTGCGLLLSAVAASLYYMTKDAMGTVLTPSSFTEMTPAMNTLMFLAQYHQVAFTVATCVVMYIAYLKLKEKELR